MTTKELLDLILGYRWFQDEKIRINPGDVYIAAHFAQHDICRFGLILEDTATLGLAPNQERYKFSALDITDATNESPIVIESEHNYNTGDEIVIDGVTGNTAANGRWKVTRIDDNHYSLDGSVGNGVYEEGGRSYHLLMSALMIKGDMHKVGEEMGAIEKRDKYQVDFNRRHFGKNSQPAKVLYWYEIHGQTIEVGFQGIPAKHMTVELMYYRKPQEYERIREGVDPILPTDYDRLHYSGTLYHLFDMLPHPKAKDEADRWMNKFLTELVAYGDSAVKQRISYYVRMSNIKWKG